MGKKRKNRNLLFEESKYFFPFFFCLFIYLFISRRFAMPPPPPPLPPRVYIPTTILQGGRIDFYHVNYDHLSLFLFCWILAWQDPGDRKTMKSNNTLETLDRNGPRISGPPGFDRLVQSLSSLFYLSLSLTLSLSSSPALPSLVFYFSLLFSFVHASNLTRPAGNSVSNVP